jgi:hypothetical protein
MKITVETKFSPGDLVTFAGMDPAVYRQKFAVVYVQWTGTESDGETAYYLRGICAVVRWEGEQKIANGPDTSNGLYRAIEHELVTWEPPPEKSRSEQ